MWLQPEEEPTFEKVESIISYWSVENIEETYQSLIHHGATEHEKPQNVGVTIITASVKDPWGNIIGVVYNPEFSI